jgi:endonuclease/exonuclease/phosphatase family metal-dependent hydrolase
LIVMSQNVHSGALTDGRWADLVTLIRQVRPDILLPQEVDWLADPANAKQAAADLEMQMTVAPSRNLPTAVAWNPDAPESAGVETKYSLELHHGYCAPH